MKADVSKLRAYMRRSTWESIRAAAEYPPNSNQYMRRSDDGSYSAIPVEFDENVLPSQVIVACPADVVRWDSPLWPLKMIEDAP